MSGVLGKHLEQLSVGGCILFPLNGDMLKPSRQSQTDTLINVARLCFGLNMFTTSPLEAFVCREVSFGTFAPFSALTSRQVIETLHYPDKPFSYRRHVVVTTVLTFSTMLGTLSSLLFRITS